LLSVGEYRDIGGLCVLNRNWQAARRVNIQNRFIAPLKTPFKF
jgi:hypothetical protein